MSGKPGGKPRRNPGVAGPRPDLKEARQREAQERHEAYSKLSAVEVIAMLDLKFGEGQGAKKERLKLAKRRQQKEWAAEQPAKEPSKRAMGAVMPPSKAKPRA